MHHNLFYQMDLSNPDFLLFFFFLERDFALICKEDSTFMGGCFIAVIIFLLLLISSKNTCSLFSVC